MKYIKVILLFQPILFVVHGSYHSQNTTVVDTHWTNFKLKFNKSYPTPQDEQLRFNYFVENLKLADTRNEMEIKLGGSAVHGITKFSDLAQTEYESLYTMRHLKSFEDIFDETNILNHAHPAKLELPKDSVGMVDWTDQYTTPVKDQVPRFFSIKYVMRYVHIFIRVNAVVVGHFLLLSRLNQIP